MVPVQRFSSVFFCDARRTLISVAENPCNLKILGQWINSKKQIGPGVVFIKLDNVSDEEKTIKLIQDAADLAAKSGFIVTLYPYFGTAVPSAEAAVPFVQKVNRPNVGLTLHMPQEIKGGNARRFPEIISKVKQYINLVVICGSDLPKEGDQPAKWSWSRMMRPLGEGDFDVATFVKEVKASGYHGHYAEICWGIETPAMDYLPRAFQIWKTMMNPENFL